MAIIPCCMPYLFAKIASRVGCNPFTSSSYGSWRYHAMLHH